MKYKIGFDGSGEEEQRTEIMAEQPKAQIPVPSVVQVRFPGQGRSLAYYNDSFDLRVGDVVFVEGKLEGKQGIVTEVARSFRIKLSDYKRVIATADTKVSGKLYFGGKFIWGENAFCLEPMDNRAFCKCERCSKLYEPEREGDKSQHSTYWFTFVNEVARQIKAKYPRKRISTLAYMSHEGLPKGLG